MSLGKLLSNQDVWFFPPFSLGITVMYKRGHLRSNKVKRDESIGLQKFLKNGWTFNREKGSVGWKGHLIPAKVRGQEH